MGPAIERFLLRYGMKAGKLEEISQLAGLMS